ncbi:MAG: hypothetical protein V4592_04875 [Bacteroidota bacterium]
MKPLLSLLIAVAVTVNYSYAQTNTFPSSGSVGIGTTSPSTTLQVSGSSGNGVVVGTTTYPSWMGTNGLYVDGNFRANTYLVNSGSNITWGASQAYIGGYNPSTGSNTYLYFATAATERLRIDHNGNVGIGTATPNTTLQISGSSGNGVVIGTSTYPSWMGTNGLYIDGYLRAGNYLVNSGSKINWGASETYISGYNPSTGSTTYLSFGTGATEQVRIDHSGNMSIGTTDAKGYKLAVNGSAIATSMIVKLNADWPDYVFKKDYELPTISAVKMYIDQNHHLPEIPSEQEVAKDGLNLGEMNKLLLKKVEELTLYLIQQKEEAENRSKVQQGQIDELKQQIETLIKRKP